MYVCVCVQTSSAVLPPSVHSNRSLPAGSGRRGIHSAERQRTGTKDEPPAQRSSKKGDLYHLLCREGGTDWRSETASRARSAHRAASSLQACDRLQLLGPPWSNCLRNCGERKKKGKLNISASSSIPSLYGQLGFSPSSAFIRGDYEGRPVAAAGRSLSSVLPPHRRVIDKRGSTLRRKWAGFATRAAARVGRSTTTPLTRGRAYLRV